MLVIRRLFGTGTNCIAPSGLPFLLCLFPGLAPWAFLREARNGCHRTGDLRAATQGRPYDACTGSDFFLFPAAAAEDEDAHDGERREGDGNRSEDASRPESDNARQNIGERDLPEPETKQVDDRGREGIPGTVEGLNDHHATGIKQETVADEAQAVHPVGNHGRIIGEEPYQPARKYYEEEPECPEKYHVVEAGEPNRPLSPLRLPCSQALSHHGRRGIAHSPGWQEREDDDTQPDRVAGHSGAPK